jgi:branched-chain amino acid transport system ATP-binding protein
VTAENSATPILEIEELVMAFGGLTALMNIQMRVAKGTIKAVIGPNGAGKTTLFNIVTGVLSPTEGEVRFNGRTVSGRKPHEIAALGVSRTFQTVELFHNMTVLENVITGRHLRIQKSFFGCGLSLPCIRRQERALKDQAMALLEFIGLADKSELMAENLPLGEQKILEIGRALATDPMLVCLDEPAAGLNETETEAAARLIQAIKAKGITVLLVEHDMKVIMNISDEIAVLNYGEKIAEGTPREIQTNRAVIEAYLGDSGGFVGQKS